MTFDFKKAKAAALSPKPIKPMKTIILGTSGAGKSSLLGTTGLDILVLFGKTEEHGPTAAATLAHELGGSVTPVEYTVWETTKDGRRVLNADASIKQLISFLCNPQVAENFQAVAIDSLTELQSVYMQSQEFFDGCKTEKGVHNKWAEGDVFIRYFETVRDCLIQLQEQGIHTFVTCAAMKSPTPADATVTSYEPNLRGFKVAQDIIRMFDDCLLVDRVEDEETETINHKLLFKANVEKKTKDQRGTVTKSLNFQPRVSGFLIQDLPESADANLSKIIAGRLKNFAKKTSK